MFTIPKFFPLISMIDGGEADGGNSDDGSQEPIDDGLGVPYAEPGEESQEPDDSEVANINPAWNDVLNFIPEDKRPDVLPKFKQWDDNFAKVQSEYAPYKPLLENKVSMDEVQRAFAFANLVNTNPKGLYDQLAERFGFGQGQQQVKTNQEDNDDDEEDNKPPVIDLTKSPEFQQLQQKLQQFEQAALQQQQAQQMEQERQAIELEFSSIEETNGVKLTPKVREEILTRTVKIGDRTGNYDIKEGYKDYASFVNQIRNSRANASAPRVFSGNGGLPANGKPLSQITDDDERAARIVAMLEAAGKQEP